MTITIKLGATASRRLDWQSILYQGDILYTSKTLIFLLD